MSETKKTLYKYQEEGVNFLKNNGTRTPYWSVLADEVGLGKTAQVLQAAKEVGAKSIWVATTKSGIVSAWMHNVKTWYPELKVVIFEKNSKSKQYPDLAYNDIHVPTIFIGTYEAWSRKFKGYMRKGMLTNNSADVLVIDEAHYLKDFKTTRTKVFLGTHGVCDRAKYRWFLTATPLLNKPMEIYPLLASHFSWVIGKMSRVAFGNEYCGPYDNGFGITFDGATNTDKLAVKLAHIMLRRTREGLKMLTQDEKPLVSKIEIEPDEALKALIKDEYKQIVERFNQEDIDHYYYGEYDVMEAIISRVKEGGAEIPMTAARRLQTIALVPDFISIIEEQLQTHDKLFIIGHHVDVLVKLYNVFKFTAHCISGSVGSTLRHKYIQDFIENPDTKILFAGINTVREAIDGLQHVCNKVIFLELHWSPKVNEQAVGRLLRYGQEKRVLVDVVILKGSISEKVYHISLEKERRIDEIIIDTEEIKMSDANQVQLLTENIANNLSKLIEIKLREILPVEINKAIKAESVSLKADIPTGGPVRSRATKAVAPTPLPGSEPAQTPNQAIPGSLPPLAAPATYAPAPLGLPPLAAPAPLGLPPAMDLPPALPPANLQNVAEVSVECKLYSQALQDIKAKKGEAVFIQVGAWLDGQLNSKGVKVFSDLDLPTQQALLSQIKNHYNV